MFDITPQTAGDLALLLEHLSGRNHQRWMKQFRRFVYADDPWDIRFLILRPWRTVTIGRYKTPEEYLEAMERVGCYVEEKYALPMVKNTPLCGVETDIELFKFTPQDALIDCRHYTEVIERMPKIGMTYCPAEVALALAAEADVHGVYVAMEGVLAHDGDYGYFEVGWKEGRRVLDSGPILQRGSPGHQLIGDSEQVVFTEAIPHQE